MSKNKRNLTVLLIILMLPLISALEVSGGSVASVNVQVTVIKPISECVEDFDCVERLCQITSCELREDNYYYMKWIW